MTLRKAIGFKRHIPRGQLTTIGKQEGTVPKRSRGKKKTMNIQDQMRAWQDTLDGGSIVEVRRAAVEILAQLRHTLENPTPPEGTGWVEDFTGKHYQEVSAMVDNVRGTLDEWERNKKKTILVSIVREIVRTAE